MTPAHLEHEWLDRLGPARPVAATLPTRGARHELGANLKVARALGTPLLPWQAYFIRVVTEKHPTDPRRYRYPVVIGTTPRQVGKTTTTGNALTTRGLRHPGRRSFYTAQTGKDASARWKDLISKVLEAPALRDVVDVRLAAGSQSLILPTGSSINPFAPTPKSLHGYTPDDVVVDEAFALTEADGADLNAAIGPAQQTRPSRQTWWLSTRGPFGESLFFDGLLERGLAAVAAQLRGEHTDVAFFDWSLPEGLDPHDEASWSFHPGLGHLFTLEDMRQLHDEYRDDPGTWMRGFMNRPAAGDLSYALDPAWLQSLYPQPQTPPAAGEVSLAFEVAADRSRSVVWASWHDVPAGRPAARIVAEGPGTEWLPGQLDRIRQQLRPRAIGADDGGPTRDVVDELRTRYTWAGDAGAPGMGQLQTLGARDFATACDALKARVLGNGLLLAEGADGRLAEAAGNAVTRTMGQGWAWDRIKSRGPIPDLIALTVALRLTEHAPAPAPAPEVYFA